MTLRGENLFECSRDENNSFFPNVLRTLKLTSVLASTKAPSSEERENSTSSIPSMQHRRSSADEALISRVVDGKEEPASPPSPPPSSAKLMSNFEQRRRRRHLFISHRAVHSEAQRQVEEAIAVATVIVTLESDENTVSTDVCS